QQNPVRRYFRLLKWTRLTTFAFLALFVVYLAWDIPWMRVGLDVEDYTEEFSLTMFLVIALGFTGVAALFLRGSAEREREALTAWATVYDQVTGLRNRRYFLDRLCLESQRAAEHGGAFDVVLFSIETDQVNEVGHFRPPRPEVLREFGRVIAGEIRASDVVAVIGATELAVLQMAAGPDVTELVVEAVLAALDRRRERDPKHPLRLRVGRSRFGRDGVGPGELLRAAREHLVPVTTLADLYALRVEEAA
ncbi:MAG TPA: diguanylate cyclase, partial [Dehalococcoidia bacterium]|nr:diguanylate cyclase [Dehalococcoidia bacterium]